MTVRSMAPWQQASAEGDRVPPVRLQKHGGIFSSVNPADWMRQWRYPNHLMLAVPWPVFFALIAVGYVLLHLVFAALYWLDPHGISGVAGPATSFLEAFFFSVHTLGAIGYGALYPSSLFTNLIVTIESLVGLILIALITGSTFSRFSRSTARILFSDVATVHAYNGLPTLMFRVANERRKTILDAKIRTYLAIDERTSEGHRMRRLHPMTLNRDCAPLFLLTWTVMHAIDQHSPLHRLTPQELTASQADIVISFSGIDETLERPIHAHHNYPIAQVLFGERFVDMMEEQDGEGQSFDFANFNRTSICPSVEPS
ncbi:Inward rectifier potassium channel Kirbac3.1 [Synechococcus sp. CBW1107]|jgi:inward rectifier potassium channel|uniref:ion channel n=1 Tax=Synechococcus sp. CBW1107 TaxID=2789857 RepID=UPI001E32F147|nr:ion channel [Synechococcus sp. CBW1107]CAK6692980.1 Inward rectifier potassium channel Kirbac3.1 [Synechococcus sp. CBW1107]